MKLITTNLEGKVNKVHIGEYESCIYMMKYNELYIRKDSQMLKKWCTDVKKEESKCEDEDINYM